MKNLFLLFQNKRFILIFFSAIFLLVIILGLFSPNCGGEERIVKIEKGWGLSEVGQKLKDEGLISNKWMFVLYVWIRGYNNHLQAGEYLLSPKMSMFKIAKTIALGEVNPNWVKITIPEGWTNKQIEERLIKNEVIGSDDKLSTELQGYLFPDTYYFYRGTGVDSVVKKMRENFDKKVGKDTKYDILKMASILEKEVISDEDRAIVSGIFWKRIKNSYPLQSCATIAYILGKEKLQYSYADTRVKSPYNTYLNIGLPPTPINNPGLSAIKAALNPKQTDYNFFLTDPATSKTIFSKTLEDHNANKVKYLK